MSEERQVYIFVRDRFFYPVELKDDYEAARHAILNPGTTRVEDINGRVVWPKTDMLQ